MYKKYSRGRMKEKSKSSRPARYVERQSPYLMQELKRVFFVSSVCFVLLAFLVVVERS
tara:strand:- start:367 stop:540 length:174 start_codon:yes stop_codon:yes gene_type:complete